MDDKRSFWNVQQQALRHALARSETTPTAIDLFLQHHAMVHAAEMTGGELWSFDDELWSFDDELWRGLSEEKVRRIPPNGEHSIAWALWHIARIEDMTMNVLLAGGEQVFEQEGWFERLNTPWRETGNALDAAAIAALSAAINIEALRAYRLAVGRRTRAVVSQLSAQEIKQKVRPERLQLLLAQGAVAEGARGLLEYWGGLTIAGLLLMPPTRHNFLHLNEAARLKQKPIPRGG